MAKRPISSRRGTQLGDRLAGGHLGVEHGLPVPLAGLELPDCLQLGRHQGLVVVVVVLHDFHSCCLSCDSVLLTNPPVPQT